MAQNQKSTILSTIRSCIESTIEQYNINKIVIAYSGGSDSQFLLHCVSPLSTKKEAIHINYNVSPNSQHWAQFCQKNCESLSIDFTCYDIDMSQQDNNFEQAAREKRYQIFSQHSGSKTLLLTGHHLDDQAETVLMRLFRGAGIDGLGGIEQISYQYGTTLYRPLLEITKEEIQNTLKENQIQWIDDESNERSDYDRNFIRNEIMPQLKKRWPSVNKNIARTSNFCKEHKAAKDKDNHQMRLRMIDDKDNLFIKPLRSLDKEKRQEVIRYHIKSHNFYPPTQKIMKAIDEQIVFSQSNGQIFLKDYNIFKYNEKIYIVHKEPKLEFQKNYPFDVVLASELFLSTKALTNGNHKTLKKIFQENRIEPWLRDLIPIAVIEGEIIGIGNILKTDYCPYRYNDTLFVF